MQIEAHGWYYRNGRTWLQFFATIVTGLLFPLTVTNPTSHIAMGSCLLVTLAPLILVATLSLRVPF